MTLDVCLQTAINAGEVDPTLGRKAQEHYRELVTRYVASGAGQSAAERLAADEAIASITKGAKSRRHATLQQLATMQRNEARYAQADPDRIVKDVELVRSEQHAIEKSYMAGLHDFLKATKTNIIGQVRNRAQLLDVVRELHGQGTGNVAAREMAQSLQVQFERARAMFNSLGGDIGKLADWGLPHTHNARKIARAGFDRWFGELWGNNRIAWHRIIDHDTGKAFTATPGARPNEARAKAFLKDIFDGITTRGWDDRAPSMAVSGKSIANRRADPRVLHFNTADHWIAYNDAFGAANPFEAAIGHLRGMARDIAMMRAFGPNPKMGLTHAGQVMEKSAQLAKLDPVAREKLTALVKRKADKAAVMMRFVSGEASVPGHEFWAAVFAGTRNLLTAAQLGSAPLSTVTDWSSMRLAASSIGLNPNSANAAVMRSMVEGFTPAMAKDMGFMLDTWFEAGASMARFTGDVWAPEVTSRISNAVLRANGLSFLTDHSRTGVQMAMGSDLADLAGKAWAELPKGLRNFMDTRRIGAADWDAVRAHLYTDPTGRIHVNGEWFRQVSGHPEAEDIAIRWGALVQDYTELAIPTASLRGQATLLGKTQPGTFIGELARSGFMYKSFAFSQLFNQIRRVAELDGGPGTKAAYAAKYVFMMTIMGMIGLQLKELAKGRDPRPMDRLDTWGGALLQGGGVGIFGDFFAANTSRAGGGLAETLGGPMVGLVGDLGRATISNAARVGQGKAPLIGRDVANLARRYNPIATFQPPLPIPVRAALDRILWDHLQAFLDPEAEDLWRQAERKLERTYGTQSWWKRGEVAPDRAPDLTNIVSP